MTPELIAAALRLTETLAAENHALAALDLTRAAGMLEDKTQALAAFEAAQALIERGEAASRPASSEAEAAQVAQAEQVATRLRTLAEENRRRLEHAIAVQGRVIGLVARAAIPGQVAEQGGIRYGAHGGAAEPKPRSVALSARA